MIPGPTIIRTCSACGKLIAELTTLSGNTFGARYWTDGKVHAPMFPDRPRIGKCPHCGAFLWIDEQKEVGERGWGREGRRNTAKLDGAQFTSWPTVKDYAELLAAGIGDKKKELYVRTRLWWAGNDARREPNPTTALEPFEVENLRALASLLAETDEDGRIMKAEALRELGMFEEAEALLAMPCDDRRKWAVSAIRELCHMRITAVKELIRR